MIREGAYSYVQGEGVVEPFTGKYAVKSADVFDRINARWQAAGNDFRYYNPLRMEVELTTKCNDTCPSCGMGALPLREGKSIDSATIDRMVADFASVGIPSLSITGGEPFVATHGTLRLVRRAREHSVDVSKITSNGLWGSPRRCDKTFDALEDAGFLDNELFVPLVMLSVGEQTVNLEYVARILHRAVSRYSHRELTVAVSSLADPAVREHRVYELIEVYERLFGEFPHDRVHSTMRVYLNNDRLLDQKESRRPGTTTVSRWMKSCFACFTPSVGTYILPTGLVKQDGKFYTCGAFNVPEKLAFGNVFEDGIRTVLDRINDSLFVKRVREGDGLKGLNSVVPQQKTDSLYAPSYCDSCTLLIDEHDNRTGERTGYPGDVLVPVESLFRTAQEAGVED